MSMYMCGKIFEWLIQGGNSKNVTLMKGKHAKCKVEAR